MDVARLADDSARGGSGTMDVGKSEGAPMTADNTVEFLDLYNRLERLIRERYNLSRDGGAIAWLLSRDKAPPGASRRARLLPRGAEFPSA